MAHFSRPALSFAGLVVGLAALIQPSRASESEAPAAFKRYSTAHVKPRPAKEDLAVTSELDPVTFPLNAFAGRYRIVRFEIRSQTEDRLDLDSAKDRFVAR